MDESDCPETSQPNALLDLILSTGRTIALPQVLLLTFGDPVVSVFLAQAIYWQRWASKHGKFEGRWYKSRTEWTTDTGLLRGQQDRARSVLRSHKILEEQRVGYPARLHFRVNFQALASLLAESRSRWSNPDHPEGTT